MNEAKRDPASLSNAALINQDSFERLRSRKYRRTFDEWIFIILVLLFLCAVLFAVCGLIFFRAKEVRVEGGTYYDNAAILAETGITDRDNLFFIDEQDLQNRLTLQFPYIHSITLQRILPTTLIIRIEEDKPAYYTEINGDAFLLSETLRVLARADDTETVVADLNGLIRVTLPTVTYAVVGRQLEFERASTYRYMMNFFAVLKGSRYADSINRIRAESKFRISVYLYDDRYKVIFGSAEEAEDKLQFFTAILEQKLEENAYAVVDVSDPDRAFVSLRDGPIKD